MTTWNLYHRMRRLENIMTAFQDQLTKINADLDDISTQLTSWRDKHVLSDSQAAQELQPLIDRLDQLKIDPNTSQSNNQPPSSTPQAAPPLT